MGNSWYYGFMSPHKDEIKRKAKVRLQDQKHHQWVTYDNFTDMYNCVYERIVSAAIAQKVEEQKTYSADRNEITENQIQVYQATILIVCG